MITEHKYQVTPGLVKVTYDESFARRMQLAVVKKQFSLDLLTFLGIPFTEEKSSFEAYEWSGKLMYVKDECWEILVHNACHLMLAPRWRRFKPEFGLTSAPNAREHVEPLISLAECDRDEQHTRLLTLAYQMHIEGEDCRVHPDNDLFHHKTFWYGCKRLSKLGLLDEDFRPTVLPEGYRR